MPDPVGNTLDVVIGFPCLIEGRNVSLIKVFEGEGFPRLKVVGDFDDRLVVEETCAHGSLIDMDHESCLDVHILYMKLTDTVAERRKYALSKTAAFVNAVWPHVVDEVKGYLDIVRTYPVNELAHPLGRVENAPLGCLGTDADAGMVRPIFPGLT